MLFSSIAFIYFFLPLSFFIYYSLGDRYKNASLAVFSLIFFSLGEAKYLWLLITVVTISYLYGMIVESLRKKEPYSRKIDLLILYMFLFILFVILSFFKYYDFLVENINSIFDLKIKFKDIALPLGISFYIFQASGYMIDIYRDKIEVEKNYINFLSYLIFFPQLIAGPIVRYQDVSSDLYDKSKDWNQIYSGIQRFILGLSKKVLLANQLGIILENNPQETILYYWIKVLAFTLQIYFDFSGYSDMAIGMGKMFGYNFPENFSYPFISQSISEFWTRWHMTLGVWFREYIYIPLGGNRVPFIKWIRNILLVWSLTGLWHGASWNFIFWGLSMAFLLIIEKIIGWEKIKIPIIIKRFITFILILMTFSIFESTSLNQGLYQIKSMWGLNSLKFTNTISSFYLRNYLFLLAISLFLSTPILKKIILRMGEKLGDKIYFLELFTYLLLLYMSTASLVSQSFNPFLYFRF